MSESTALTLAIEALQRDIKSAEESQVLMTGPEARLLAADINQARRAVGVLEGMRAARTILGGVDRVHYVAALEAA